MVLIRPLYMTYYTVQMLKKNIALNKFGLLSPMWNKVNTQGLIIRFANPAFNSLIF